MDRTVGQALVGEAARYLEDTAAQTGGRNTRPLAIPVLATTYCGGTRTGTGVGVVALGAFAGAAAWFGIEQLTRPDPSIVLAVVGLVLAAALGVAAVLMGLRLVRSGMRLVAALRRWHEIAPEVPVRGVEVLTQQAGILRVALAGVAVLLGLGALVLAVVLEGGLAVWVGTGVAAAALLGVGAVAGLGWSRVRSLLAPTAPQSSQETFAPAPYAQPHAPAGVAVAPQYGQPAPHYAQTGTPAPPPQQWAPPPPGPPESELVRGVPTGGPTQPQPWFPAGAQPGGETWHPASEREPDLGDTRLVADTTMSGRSRRPAVVLDDGRRLTAGVVTLLGRAPHAKDTDLDVETVAVLHPTVSKTHASIRVTDKTVYVIDRSSTNGSTAVDPDGAQRRLEPWVESEVEIGGAVLLGSYRVGIVAADDV